MEERVIKSNGIAYLPTVAAAVSLGTGGASLVPGSKTTQPVKKDGYTSGRVAFWGNDNLFPQKAYKDVSESTIMRPIIDWQVRALYSGGVETVLVDYDDDGKEKIIYKDKALEPAHNFNRTANVNRYLGSSVNDFYYYYNIYPELIMNKNRDKVVTLNSIPAAKGRWEIRQSGLVSDNLYVLSDWQQEDESKAVKVPTIDPYNYAVESLKENPKVKFIYPVSYPDALNDYYTLAPWDSFRKSKWHDFVKSVPEFKSALMKNQMAIRWHIQISTDYWPWKYKEVWEDADSKKRNELIDETLEELVAALSGAENAGKAVLTHMLWDQAKGEHRDLIKIEKLEDKYPNGILIEDSTEGSSHGLFAFGVHPTLFGHAPGSAKSSMGAGSGSDQRVAWNNYMAMVQLHKDLLMEPLLFVRDFNGWDPRIQWRFKNLIQQTLDTGKEVTQQAS